MFGIQGWIKHQRILAQHGGCCIRQYATKAVKDAIKAQKWKEYNENLRKRDRERSAFNVRAESMNIPNPLKNQESIDWYTSKEVKLRSSLFIGHHIRVYTPRQVELAVAMFRNQKHKLIKGSTHGHIYAWRVGTKVEEDSDTDNKTTTTKGKEKIGPEDGYTDVFQGYYDDGERLSGQDLFRRCIKRNKLYNVLVIVTRWKRANNIGPSRFKCIGEAGYDSLKKGGLIDPDVI